MTTRVTVPSKMDLFAAIKSIERQESTRVQKLNTTMHTAEQALREFEATNATHRRLTKTVEVADKRYWKARKEERDKHKRELKVCRNRVRLEGVTPATLRAVTALVKRYS